MSHFASSFPGRAASIAACLVALVAAPEGARAQALVPPPPPDREPPYFAWYAAADFVAPIVTDPLCPGDGACVLSGGGGLEVGFERHLPRGLRLGGGYGAWLHDGGGVYEVATLQWLGVRGRQELLPGQRAHPFVGVGLGLVLFGDTFAVATAGGGVEIDLGVDVELDAAVRLRVSMPWRLFALAPFTTPNDDVARASGFGVVATMILRVGLVVLETP